MKTCLMALMVVAGSLAHADSCAPTVQAAPDKFYCGDDTKAYEVTINALMSPPQCTGADNVTIYSASVAVSDLGSAVGTTIAIDSGDFTFDIPPGGFGASLQSAKYGLDLKNCVYAVPGAASIGNKAHPPR